jgi:protein Tex
VKIDPKSIGVGQYQHDISEPALKRNLDLVVDSCVNQVGVSLNTASIHLLSHVAGIGPALARAIVEHRGQSGLFNSRQALLEVPRFSAKTFEQAAGFLRVSESENALDNTGVHPERYRVLEDYARSKGKTVRDLLGPGTKTLREDSALRQSLGNYTFEDILRELEKPGRDPRDAFVVFQFREDIHELKDLKPGMSCPGIVTNVTNFGAFVDIGVHQDGLVHLSQMANRYVKDPHEVASPGDRVQVKVLEVNLDKSQISLTMKIPVEAPRPAPRRRQERRPQKPHGPQRPQGPQQRFGKGPFKPKPRPPRPVFNNAFAGLAALRNQLKPKK